MDTEAKSYIVEASAAETAAWAHRPGNEWPCSSLAGRAVRVAVRGDDIVAAVGVPDDCPREELEAFLTDSHDYVVGALEDTSAALS